VPLTLQTGEIVNKLSVAAGTIVTVPIQAINRSKLIWGEDALEFRPERWLNGEAGIPKLAKQFQGFHHLLTFVDGQRTCLGKTFAVTEIKVSLHRTNTLVEAELILL
jgi:cytochrome P450